MGQLSDQGTEENRIVHKIAKVKLQKTRRDMKRKLRSLERAWWEDILEEGKQYEKEAITAQSTVSTRSSAPEISSPTQARPSHIRILKISSRKWAKIDTRNPSGTSGSLR